jgi:hypothetical protein
MDYTSHDGAEHRVHRLIKATRIATAIMGLTDDQAQLLIHGLHDDRGTLVVRWRCSPSAFQVAACAVAWEQCGERGDSVRHVVGG